MHGPFLIWVDLIQKQSFPDVLQNVKIFTGKHLCWSLRPVTLLKQDSKTGVFLWILRNFQEHLIWRTSWNEVYPSVSLSAYAKFSDKLILFTPWYAHMCTYQELWNSIYIFCTFYVLVSIETLSIMEWSRVKSDTSWDCWY